MVSGYRHRPGLVAVVEAFQELRGVGHVLGGVKHLAHGCEFCAVKMDVDLHAPDIDQFGTALAGVLDQLVGFRNAGREIGLSLNVDGVRAQ